jgi:hypothetical protein
MGMEGVGRFDDTPEHRPQNWRQKVLQEDPNGDAPITAILSKLKNEVTDDYQYNWFEKEFPEQGGDVDGIYLNAALTTAYSDAVPANTIVYAKVDADTAGLFVPGAAGLLRCGTDFTADLVGKVVDVVKNGSRSYLAIRLLRADGQGNSTLTTCDYLMRVGSIFGEGAKSPSPISRESMRKFNYTQTFRTALEITGRMLNTTFRTGDKYQERKGDSLKDHMRDIEWGLGFGEMSDIVNEEGQHETTTKGIRAFIRDYAPDNLLDFTTQAETLFKGKTWLEAGDAFFEKVMEQVTGIGPEERLVIGGNGVLAGLNALARNRGQWTYTTETRAYGIAVREYVTPFGRFDFMRHPLFNKVPSLKNAAFVLYPGFLRYRFHKGRDTHFKRDPNNPFLTKNKLSGPVDIDGIHEEYLTDCGLELWHPECHAFISGIGQKNTQN